MTQTDNQQTETDAPEENNKKLGMFISYALQGAEALRRHLSSSIDEEFFLRVAGAAHRDARAYVIYGALDEAEKVAMHLMRLDEFLSGEELLPHVDRVSRNIVTSILEEVRAHGRRLVELLVTLVLFKTTNDQNYFRHLLLIEDMVRMLRENLDLEDFHGARNIGLDKRIEDQVIHIVDLHTATPTLTRAWYAGDGVERLRSGVRPNPNNLLSSARARIQRALPDMTAIEKINFGFTYGEGYGEPSEMIHYSVRNEGWKIRPGEEIREANRLGLLAWDVLLRCHELLDSPDLPVIRDLAHVYQLNTRPAEIVQRQMVRDLKMDDFVLVYGVTFLAEILEVAESRYGYRSFRVRFLAERPMLDVEEDWFPARSVRKLYTRDELLRCVNSPSESESKPGSIPEEYRAIVAEVFAEATPEQIQEGLRETLKNFWNAGLRDWFHQGLYLQQGSRVEESPPFSEPANRECQDEKSV